MCRANEPRSKHVVREQFLFRGKDAPPARGSEILGSLWQSSSRPLRLKRQLSLPNLFYEKYGYPDPRVTQSSTLFFPSSHSDTAGTQASQGTMAQASFDSPLWRNQPWVSELFQPLIAAPWLIPLRQDLLSQANGTIWHPRPEL